MTIWKRWIQRSVLCGLLLGGLVGCAAMAHPPIGQIAQNDHAALAAWYDKEAAHLRGHAKDMTVMAEEYRKNPSLSHGTMGGIAHKTDQAVHCDVLAGIYTKAAEEADELARGHRSMVK